MSELQCPNCKHEDQVQRVEAIFKSGTSIDKVSYRGGGWTTTIGTSGGKTYFGGGPVATYGSKTSTSHTHLARELAPPLPPQRPTRIMVPHSKGVTFGNAVVPFVAVLLVAGGYVFFAARESVSRFGVRPDLLIQSILIIVSMAFVVATLCAIQSNRWYSYRLRLTEWERELAAWTKLNYCHRCAIVFDSKVKQAVPVSRLIDLLH